MTISKIDRRVVEGIRLPNDGPANHNEMQWLQLLRLVFRDNVPPPLMGIARARQMLSFSDAMDTQLSVQQN